MDLIFNQIIRKHFIHYIIIMYYDLNIIFQQNINTDDDITLANFVISKNTISKNEVEFTRYIIFSLSRFLWYKFFENQGKQK